jgi:cytidylate kinase
MVMQDELIARQMRRWELDQRLQERFARDEAAAHVRRDVLTISRERGSGGTTVGMMVAKELGWEYYDRELIDRVAQRVGSTPEEIEAHDERAPGVMHQMLLQLLEGKHPTGAQYLRSLVRLLRSLRDRGNAVIMGRGGHLILSHSLRVRVVAPLELRVERVAELESLSPEEARHAILSADRDRRHFLKSAFGIDADDPTYFDLVLNTETMSLEHAAHLVHCALETRRSV